MKNGTYIGSKGFRYALLGATILTGISGVAYAQDAAPPAAADEVVVVTGFKKSYADAVKSKKQSIEITDGISSDGLGRFPDLNVGEALQRIPGVQINREAEGRNATVGLRGKPSARTELWVKGGYIDGSDFEGSFAGYLGGQVSFNRTWGLVGEVEVIEDTTRYSLGVRASF